MGQSTTLDEKSVLNLAVKPYNMMIKDIQEMNSCLFKQHYPTTWQ